MNKIKEWTQVLVVRVKGSGNLSDYTSIYNLANEQVMGVVKCEVKVISIKESDE